MIGLQAAAVARGDEHQRLHDLAELGAERRRPPPRPCGSTRRRRRPRGSRPCARPRRGRVGRRGGRWVGHGAESSIGPIGRSDAAGSIGRCRRSSSPTATSATRADARRRLARLARRRAPWSSRPTAARGTPSGLGLRSTGGSATATRSARPGSPRSRGRASRSSSRRRQGRVGHGARASAPPSTRGADAIIVLGALGGPRLDHALANVGLLAHARLARRSS